MSREIKLGAFALIVLVVAIWGLTFLKGQNLLTQSFTYKTILTDVTQLVKSSPVYINGLQVGTVIDIELNPANIQEMVVTFDLKKGFKVPKDATVELASDGIVGGKSLKLVYDKLCNGDNCAQDNHIFKGVAKSLLSTIVTVDEIKEYTAAIGGELSGTFDGLGSEDGKGPLNEAIRELNQTMKNLSSITERTDNLMRKSSDGLSTTINNMATITSNLAANNDQITAMLANFNGVAMQLKDADMGSTITTSNATLDEAKNAMTQLTKTLEETEKVMADLSEVAAKANAGDGTLSKLLNDKELYDNLEMTSKNMSLLLQDLRLNPSRYVKVSVFGRKNKEEYVKPEDDPAFKE